MSGDPFATVLTSPLVDVIDADLALDVAAVQADGSIVVATQASAESVKVTSGWIDPVDDVSTATRLWDRIGQPAGNSLVGALNLEFNHEFSAEFPGGGVGGGDEVYRFDYASPSARTFLTDGMYQELAETWDFGGIDVASVDGEPGYDPPVDDREHIPHGGVGRTVGLVEALEGIQGVKIAELQEENLAGSLDLAPDADDLHPGHLSLAEEDLLSLGVTDVDPQSRDMAPPLWSIIYGQRGQAGRLVAPLTTVAQAGGMFHPTIDAAWDGMTQDQWNELLAFQCATLGINGMVPMLQTVAEHFGHRVQSTSAEPIVGFVGSLFQALNDTDWCAKFLGYGLRELPLIIHGPASEFSQEFNAEFGTGDADGVDNPVRNVLTLVAPSLRAAMVPPTAAFADSRSTAAFQVYPVLHSVWRDRVTDAIGFVVMNWTSHPVRWQFTFNPWLYWTGEGSGTFSLEFNAEFPVASATYAIDKLNSDGTETSIATGLNDSSNLTFSGTEGTIVVRDVSLGDLPAYSIQAYRLTQE